MWRYSRASFRHFYICNVFLFRLMDLQSFSCRKVYGFLFFSLEFISLGKKTCLFFLVLISTYFTENDWLNFKFVVLVYTHNAFIEYQNYFACML